MINPKEVLKTAKAGYIVPDNSAVVNGKVYNVKAVDISAELVDSMYGYRAYAYLETSYNKDGEYLEIGDEIQPLTYLEDPSRPTPVTQIPARNTKK